MNDARASGHRSLIDVLAERAQLFGDRNAYTFQNTGGDETISFAELDLKARSIAGVLQETIEPGDRVLLLFHAGLDFITSFFGCLYAGALAVPSTFPKPRRPMPRLQSIARNCGATAVLTDSNTLGVIDKVSGTPEFANTKWIAVDSITDSAASKLSPLEISRSDLAFLQYTSGSTSDPKGVMVSHGNLLHNLETIRQGFDLRSAEEGGEVQNGVFWLPAYHDMGLIGGILETMYVGGHSVLMSPAAFLQRPIGWLESMSKYSATISGAPNFAYELCCNRATEEQCSSLDLSNWKVAFCGAEPIRPETLHMFAEKFAVSGFSQDSFYPCFGLAEGTLLASGAEGPGPLVVRHVDRDALAENRIEWVTQAEVDGGTGQSLVGCGDALNGQRIAIVDAKTREECGDDSVGEIWLNGPSVAGGYWGHEEETKESFHAHLATGDGPFLRTGDLGFKSEGQLYVTGRVKDVIIIRGRNHYPQDIEKTACDSHEALRQDSGAVFTLSGAKGDEQVIVVHEIDRQYRKADFDEVIRAVRRSVAEVHEMEVHGVVLIRHMSLPRTTSGKAQRHLCRKQMLSGDLKLLADWKKPVGESADKGTKTTATERLKKQDEPMTPDEIDRLAERIESWTLNWLVERAAIAKEDVHRDRPFAEYGLDSLTAVELSQELEDWVGVEVVPTVAWNYPTPATLSVYLAREAGGATDEQAIADEAADEKVDDEFAKLLAEIESLSDEDAAAALGDATSKDEDPGA